MPFLYFWNIRLANIFQNQNLKHCREFPIHHFYFPGHWIKKFPHLLNPPKTVFYNSNRVSQVKWLIIKTTQYYSVCLFCIQLTADHLHVLLFLIIVFLHIFTVYQNKNFKWNFCFRSPLDSFSTNRHFVIFLLNNWLVLLNL